MRISQLSAKTGVSIRSLRYYEEKGLVTPQRLENGYRQYSFSDIERVNTIQLLLDVGFNTDEIKPSCSEIPTAEAVKCAPEAIFLYEGKLKDTQQQIKRLKEVESELKRLLSFWKGADNQTKVK